MKRYLVFLKKVEKIRGMDITLVTTGNDKKATFALLKAMNFPFIEKKNKKEIN